MAVDAPPALPPIAAPVQELRQAAAGSRIRTAFGEFELSIDAAGILDADDINDAIDGATDLSTAVRLIARAAYIAGYPGAQLSYARDGNTVWLRLRPGEIAGARAPEPLNQYFASMEPVPLRADDLEPRRALASVHADRAGTDYQARVDSPDDGRGTLRLRETGGNDRNAQTYVEIGNPGNRFVGRHFIDGLMRRGFGSGDELTGFARFAITAWNDEEDSDLNELLLNWSRVNRFGIFGLGWHRVGYDLNVGGEPISAEIREAELTWLYPLFADFASRTTLRAKAERTRNEVYTDGDGQLIRRELYTSGEAGVGYTRTMLLGADRIELESELAFKQGFGDDNVALTVADLGYSLWRPAVRGRYISKSGQTWTLEYSGQFSSDAVPEQQQFVLGGVGNLHASLPGLAVGDSGGLARLQWQPTDRQWLGVIGKLKVFAEYGYAQFETDRGGRSTQQRSQSDVGLEVTGEFPYGWTLAATYASVISESGIDEQAAEDAEADFFFRLRKTF